MSEPYLAPGDTIRGRWTIDRELGRGGYSIVYLAHDRDLDTEVALKLLVPPPAAAKVARERMRREVQVVRGLSHENIVAVYDFVEDGPWSFILMEYVAGPDLHVRVRERGPLTADQAVRLGRDIAAALGTAHRHGILHRDVKPQNVLLDPDGRYRLTDFGSARLDGQVGVTTTGAVTGTRDYTAPEVLAGRRGDARSDMYALGLTLYFGLTGELPGHDAAAASSEAGLRSSPQAGDAHGPRLARRGSGTGDRCLTRGPVPDRFGVRPGTVPIRRVKRPHPRPAASSAAGPIRSAWGSAQPAAVTAGRWIRWCTSSASRVARHGGYREPARLGAAHGRRRRRSGDPWRTATVPSLDRGRRAHRRGAGPAGPPGACRPRQIGDEAHYRRDSSSCWQRY